MATNPKDGKNAQSSQGALGGNRAGDKNQHKADKRERENKSSQAAGKDPHRGKD